MFAPGNEDCSGSRYERAVNDILRSYQRQKPQDYFVALPGTMLDTGHEWPYLQLIKRYYKEIYPQLTPDVMAKDLVDLVSHTFPNLSQL
jgi:hypothetical protein